MANYNLADECIQVPYIFGVGKVYERKYKDVVYLVKSNTEFARDEIIGNTPMSYFKDVGNVFVGNFHILERANQEKKVLDFTWLGKDDYVALKYNPEYEEVDAVKMNIDNLGYSYFPYKKTKSSDMTLVVDASNTKMSSHQQIVALKKFIESNGQSFKDFKLVGFGKYIEKVLSYTGEKKLKSVQKGFQKSLNMQR